MTIEQIGGFVFYSLLCPPMFHLFKDHMVACITWLITLQSVFFFGFLYVYDRTGKDIFHIVEAKRRFREKFNWKRDHTARRPVLEKILVFIVCALKWTPPLVLLLMRIEGRKGRPFREIAIVFLAIVVDTAYSFGIYAGVRWLKTVFLGIVLFAAFALVCFFIRKRRQSVSVASQPLSQI